MVDLNKLAKRILANKKNKGFPTNRIDLDVKFIQAELDELLKATTPEERAGEICDCIIFLLGIASYENIDIEAYLQWKLSKIEKRKITKISDTEFKKEEGY